MERDKPKQPSDIEKPDEEKVEQDESEEDDAEIERQIDETM